MGVYNPLDEVSLRNQIRSQKAHAWDLATSLDWGRGIDLEKPLLPLDEDAIVFPGVSDEQRLALSQMMGLFINTTIAEMESVIHKLRDVAWHRALRQFPVNPELVELGDLFFEEELKHSAAFHRYNDIFCHQTGVPEDILRELLPKVWGSSFLKHVLANANSGGTAFWWVVASVEEVSIEVYKELHRWRFAVEPLYLQLHLKHLEEESRHRNYAFLMLDVMKRQPKPWAKRFSAKADLLLAQGLSTAWLISELQKALQVEKYASAHPWFSTVASALPHFRNVGLFSLIKKMFVTAPFLSVMLNTRYHDHTMQKARAQKVFSFPFPEPKASPTFPIGVFGK